MRKKIIVLAIGILVILGIVVWQRSRNTTQTTPLQTAVVEKGTIVSTVAVSGTVASANRLPVTTQASGQIKQVFVKNGDYVYANQNILEIDLDQTGRQKSAAAWSSYLSAQNSLQSAKNNLWTLQTALFSTNQKFMNGAVARDLDPTDPVYIQENATWLAAEAAYKNQTNVINQVQASLNNAWLSYQSSSPIITAPISGIISDLVLTPGMAISSVTSSNDVAQAQTLANIVTNNLPTATFNLSEIDVTKVKEDQKATLTLDAQPGKTFTGTVMGINRSGVVTSNVTNYPVNIQFDTSPDGVLPNMSVSASIITQTKDNILMVPIAAVRNNTIRVRKGNNIETIDVETGLKSDSQIEIVSGLTEGDTVVTGGGTTATQRTTTGASPFGGNLRFGGGR